MLLFSSAATITTPAAAQTTGAGSQAPITSPDFRWVTDNAPGVIGVLERPRPEYDPIGIQMGSFRLFPSVLTGLAYDDNVQARRDGDPLKKGSLTYRVQPGFLATSAYNGHLTNFYGSVEGVGYSEQDNLNHVNAIAGADGVYQITNSTKFSTGARYERQHEAFGSGESFRAFDKPVAYDRVMGYAALSQSFNRLRLGLFGSVRDDKFDSTTVGGVVIDQSYRSNTTYAGAFRAGIEVSPTLIFFAEYGADRRDFHNFDFSSSGQQVIGGIEAEFTRLIKGEIYGGYAHRDYDSTTIRDVAYTTYGVNLRWYATQLLTLALSGRRDVNETMLGGVAGTYTTSQIGGRVDYELLRNLVLAGKVGYEWRDFNEVARTDRVVTAGVSATYLINRTFSISADYLHLQSQSDVPNAEFTRNTVGVTLKTRF